METDTEKRDLTKMDWWLVRFDETLYYAPDFLKRLRVTRVWGVYLYDQGEVTHLCEFTPSYCLYEVGFLYETDIDRDDPNYELLDERAEDELREAAAYGRDSDVTYMHCHTVDAFPAKDKLAWQFDQPITDDMTYDDIRENLIEAYSANPPW